MKIKLTKPIGGNKTGATIEVTNGVAEQLTNTGYAEVAKPDTKPKAKADD